jgi:TolA-binding protein
VYFNTMFNAKKAFREAEKQNDPAQGGTRMSANRHLYDDAITKAAKVVQKHPKSKYHDDALFMVGVCYFRLDNYAKSEVAFRELLAVHPKSEFAEEAQLYLARCRMESGDEQSAYRSFSDLAVTARKPQWRAEAYYNRGLYLADNKQPDSAVLAFQTVLDSFPDSDRAHDSRLRAAQALRELNRPQEAMDLYHPLISEKEPLVRYPALIGLGEACYQAGLLDSGIAIFTAMVEQEDYADSIGNTRLLLGEGYQKRGDLDAAWRQYEQVAATLENTRWSAKAYFKMAEIKQYSHNDLVSAKDYYDKVRQEYANSDLAGVALTRSANIAKLGEFRKSLGRGGLERTSSGQSMANYDPDDLPRLERREESSPVYARPADFVPSWVREQQIADSLRAIAAADSLRSPTGSAAIAELGPPTPDEFKNPWDDPNLFGPPTPSGMQTAMVAGATEPASDSIAAVEQPKVVDLYGPPVDSMQLKRNEREVELLSLESWLGLMGSDSLLGPPSPARLYDFGTGELLGPATPDEIIYAVAKPPEVDSSAIREREARAAIRSQRKDAYGEIAAAAGTQLQLAELYRFDLSYPDSALTEYKDLIARYPTTPFAAKAMLAAADILQNDFHDTTGATAQLTRILAEQPRSDYASDAIARLGWEGTDADTAHPERAYRAAENAFLVSDNPKEAISLFKKFIKEYPYSRLVPKAEYAVAYLNDRFFPREDSTVIWAYEDLAADYPQSDIALAATARLKPTTVQPKARVAPPVIDKSKKAGPVIAGQTPGGGSSLPGAPGGSTRIPRAPKTKYKPDPVFPQAEVNVVTTEQVIVYKILINYSGEIESYEVISKSKYEDINEAARQTLAKTTFFADSIPPESLNIDYLYEIRIQPPAKDYDPLLQLYNAPPPPPGNP